MIRGKNVGLRAVEFEDLPHLRDWRNLEHFRKNFRESRELSLAHQKAWLEKVNQSPNDFMFSVIRISDNKLIGAAGLLYTNWINRSSDFSIYIGENDEYFDADGFGGEAAILLMEYGFNTLNLHKIWTELYSFDKLKINFFLNRMGFNMDATLRDNAFFEGKYHNSHILSLLSSEFKSKRTL